MGYEYQPEWKRDGVAVLESSPVRLAEGELRNIQYWNPIAGAWQSTIPTFQVDHWSGIAVYGVNLTDETQLMTMYFWCYDPTGTLKQMWTLPKWYEVAPGQGVGANFGIYCDIPGDYRTEVRLDFWGRTVDNISRVVCHATAIAEVTGRIDTWWLWHYQDGWVTPSPTLIPLGENIGIRVRGWNNSDIQLDMRADIKSISPSGKTTTKRGGVLRVDPDEFENVIWDFTWVANERGDWKADIILYAGLPGNTLDETDRRENVMVANVSTYVPPEEYEGTISSKQLEFNESRRSIPAADIPLDQRGLVHIWGRNDTDGLRRMGISWTVQDPYGTIVESYSAWQDYFTGAGKTHEFIGGRFNLDKEGTYTIGIALFMNRDDPVAVDSYSGNLCTVIGGGPPPPIYTCPYCGATFSTQAELDAHIESEHPEEVPPEEVKFPWGTVIAVGAGGMILGLLATRGKK